jgi:DNA-binding transcriptional regulator YiaG
MTIDHRCLECDAPLAMRKHTHRTRVGRYKVEDASRMAAVCSNGHAELDLETLAQYEQRAAAIVLAEAADIGGAEVRFCRKAIGLTQGRLAEMMDVAPETISRWENDKDPLTRVSRLALLAIVRAGDALDRLVREPASPKEVLRVHAA